MCIDNLSLSLSLSLQILCLSEQVLFTERCEEAIITGRLNELLIELESQLDSYTNTDIVVSKEEGRVPGDALGA